MSRITSLPGERAERHAFESIDVAETVLRRQTAYRAGAVEGEPDFPVVVEDEPRRVEESRSTRFEIALRFIEGARRRGDFLLVEAIAESKVEVEVQAEAFYRGEGVDRRGDDLHSARLELRRLLSEVGQLPTTGRSPVPAREQNHAPVPRNVFGQIDRVATKHANRQLGKAVTGIQSPRTEVLSH